MKTQKFGSLLFSSLLIISLVLSLSCKSSTLETANKDYDNLKLAKALLSYKALLDNPSISPAEKGEIYLRISRIFNKGYLLPDSAICYAEKGLFSADNGQKKEFFKQLTTYYSEANDFSKAGKYGLEFLNCAKNQRDSLEAYSLLLTVTIGEIEKEVINHAPIDINKLDYAIGLSTSIYKNQPESPSNNEKRLELFLLKGSLSDAVLAINDYFFFGDDQIITNFYAKELNDPAELANGSPAGNPSKENSIRLVKLLGEFRFYHVADLISHYHGIENAPELEGIQAYINFRKAFQKAVTTHYSEILINRESDKRFKEQLESCHKELWSKINSSSGKPYNFDSLLSMGARLFGMNSFMKERGDYHVYILGEAIYYTNANVEQYGYKAPYNYYLVDHIEGTNVRGYYYDYFEWGGWSEKELVMQNRKIMLEGAIAQCEKILDKPQTQIDGMIGQLTSKDDSLLMNKTIADLPGLRTIFEYQALAYIRDSVQKAGFSGPGLRKKMIAQIRLNDYLSSTIAHEGRHVIDSRNGFAGNDHVQTEFTANLSSIVFAPVPQMSLSRVFIYDPESKDPTGHGKADTKIVEGFLQWMTEHKNEIQGYDPARPLLSQADKLSNRQIVAICKGMDPLAKK